jgi:DNA recombination protein Rad52
MMTDDAKRLLSEPLSRSHVKERKQGGRSVSFIEGWLAISEANRIFGFDGWTRETIDLKCVAERERKIGDSGAQGWGVTYTAKVRICVGDVMREGCGAGHGIDRDLGQAHESALKEAETDAMKRALMTFGNPFGLALYDKTQAEVADVPAKKPAPAKRVDPLVQQAGIICGEKEFWRFLAVANADLAAQVVRDRCRIDSRSELATNAEAAKLWRALVAEYRAWEKENKPTIPSAKLYTEMWDSTIQSATAKQRTQIGKTWNEQSGLRGQIEWTEEHPFSALKGRVTRALEFLKEPA